MNTKFKYLLLGLLGLSFFALAPSTYAQSYSNEAELYQSLWGMEKKAIIEEYLSMNAAESSAFWPVYEEYAAARKVLGKERIDIIMEYAENYENMNDEIAADLTNKVFSGNMKLEKLQKKYYKKLSKAVSPLRASEFMQLEKYLDSAMRFEIQSNIPFLKELDRS